MSFYKDQSTGLLKHHKAPFILTIEWPDEPGQDDEREYATLEEALEFIRKNIHEAPWTGKRPSYELADADGEIVEES